MQKLIIDKNYKQYQPLMLMSMVDLFEINLKKYKQLYVYVDDLNLFYKTYKLYTDNCIFVIDKNVVIKKNNIDVELISYDVNLDYNFKDKIIKHQFIKEYFK